MGQSPKARRMTRPLPFDLILCALILALMVAYEMDWPV